MANEDGVATGRALVKKIVGEIAAIENLMAPTIIRRNGIVHIDTAHDAAFRKALMAGVPISLRGKMQEALAATPQPAVKAKAHSRRYFGAEAEAVFRDATALVDELHRFLKNRFGLDGLIDWLDAVGYGNDYRMIKVFYEWSKVPPATKPKIIVP